MEDTLQNGSPPAEDREELDLTPPPGGYDLYRHKKASAMTTKNWHGYYWARRNRDGDYEIRTVPITSGEYSTPGGVWPREGFEKHYAVVADR